jgi:hypothetical protein
MSSQILHNLIEEGEMLYPTISYVPSRPNVIRAHALYATSEKEKYQIWLSSVQRFIKTNHPSDLEEIQIINKKFNPDSHLKILGILKAVRLLPNEPEKISNNMNGSSNQINITNNQNVSQQMTINLFMEAIKDEITGRDLKALKEILKDYEKEPEKTKVKLLEKIKGFGGDVLSNIVANILTNPAIYSGLF